MNRLDQAQAAAQHSARMAAERMAKIPGWTPPTGEMTERRRLMNREFTKALGGYDAFQAVKAERLAAQAATAVDSPETAISDADSPEAHMLTAWR